MPAIVKSTQATNSGSATATVFAPALPGGVGAPAAGDLLLAVACGSLAAVPTAAPSGWTLIRNIADTTFHMSVYRKIAAGGDANPSWTATTRKWGGGTLVVAAGTFDSTTPIDVENGAAVGTTSVTAIATPSVAVGTDGCLIIGIFGNLAASTFTTPDSNPIMLEAFDTTSTGTNPASCALYHSGINSVAPGTYSRNASASVASANGCAWIGAIRPGTGALGKWRGVPVGTRRATAVHSSASW
jgi:hypothetical protein